MLLVFNLYSLVLFKTESPPSLIGVMRLFMRHAKSEADMLKPVARWTSETACTAGVTSRAVPGAASHSPVGSLLGSFRIDHFIVRVRPKPVLAPLLDITVHVIESPRIGLFSSYRLNHIIRVTTIPTDRIQAGFSATIEFRNPTSGKSGGAFCPAGIFPLSLGRKSVLFRAFFLVEFLNEILNIIP